MYLLSLEDIFTEFRSLSGGIENFPSNIISLDSINEDHIVLFNFKSDYSLAKRGFEIWYQTGKYSVFDIVYILNHKVIQKFHI